MEGLEAAVLLTGRMKRRPSFSFPLQQVNLHQLAES